MPQMKAAFDRVLKGLSGLAAVEDQDNVSFDRPIPEQLMTTPWSFCDHLFERLLLAHSQSLSPALYILNLDDDHTWRRSKKHHESAFPRDLAEQPQESRVSLFPQDATEDIRAPDHEILREAF